MFLPPEDPDAIEVLEEDVQDDSNGGRRKLRKAAPKLSAVFDGSDGEENFDTVSDGALSREALCDERMVNSLSTVAKDHVLRKEDVEDSDTSNNHCKYLEVVFFLLCNLLDR